METHGGKANFNLRETAAIIGCHYNDVAANLAECGILCVTKGKNKMVTAVSIAEYLHHGQVSPLDNRLRSTKDKAKFYAGVSEAVERVGS